MEVKKLFSGEARVVTRSVAGADFAFSPGEIWHSPSGKLPDVLLQNSEAFRGVALPHDVCTFTPEFWQRVNRLPRPEPKPDLIDSATVRREFGFDPESPEATAAGCPAFIQKKLGQSSWMARLKGGGVARPTVLYFSRAQIANWRKKTEALRAATK